MHYLCNLYKKIDNMGASAAEAAKIISNQV